MSCRALVPLVLLGVVSMRTLDLWRAGDLDPVSLAFLPVAALLTWRLVRQPGCETGTCDLPIDQASVGHGTGQRHDEVDPTGRVG